MHVLSVLLLACTGLVVSQSQDVEKNDGSCESPVESKGPALIQKLHRHVNPPHKSPAVSLHELSQELGSGKNTLTTVQRLMKEKASARKGDPTAHAWNGRLSRTFVGGSASVAGAELCTADTYHESLLESNWRLNVINWTSVEHCNFMTTHVADSWIQENIDGTFDPAVFSTICRKGHAPQYIEPLAGLLRDPRFGCDDALYSHYLMSVDWLVFPDAPAPAAPGFKSRFYDAGGTRFIEASQFFLQIYQGHGIVFDEVYVWEFKYQGAEAYWELVDAETRAFWEPRVHFYDGVAVTAEEGHENNPVSRIFKDCGPDDFCAFKLDIDTPQVELPLMSQLLKYPEETTAKLDEVFFEHHVNTGSMWPWWGDNVDGTMQTSYELFGNLRKLGVRAHSWV